MATAMAMVMEERMMARRNSLLLIVAFGLLLTGCSKSGLEITKNDILEVARDDANASKKDCENVAIKEEKGVYIVSFNTSGGSYEYKIGKDGIIQERNYKRSNSEEVSTTEPVEEKKEETKSETETKKESTSFDENQQQAINAALANAGLGQEDVADVDCTLDKASQKYTVTFTFQDIHNTCVVDAATFVVLSSIQG